MLKPELKFSRLIKQNFVTKFLFSYLRKLVNKAIGWLVFCKTKANIENCRFFVIKIQIKQ